MNKFFERIMNGYSNDCDNYWTPSFFLFMGMFVTLSIWFILIVIATNWFWLILLPVSLLVYLYYKWKTPWKSI